MSDERRERLLGEAVRMQRQHIESGTRDADKQIGHILMLADAYLADLDRREQAERERGLPMPNAVRQTTPTNCFRACVATVLGMPIEAIPEACDGAQWDWNEFQRWLAARGWQAIEITFGSGGTIYPVQAPVPCVVTGQSPRECTTGRHAVVGELIGVDGFRLLHDPHPSDLWIDGEPTHAVFFVPLTIKIPVKGGA